MTVTATPTLSVAGASVAGGLAGGPSLVAIRELSLTWGRGGLLDAPQPATAQLTLLDTSPGATFAARSDLIGQPVVLGYTGPGLAGTNFRGRITDVDVSPRRSGGFYVALQASSKLIDAANYLAPRGSVWPAEAMSARRDRILGLLPAGFFAGGVTLPQDADLSITNRADPANGLPNQQAAQVDAAGGDALALLRSLFTSMSPLPMVYDPAADAVGVPPRLRHLWNNGSGMTSSVQLALDPAGSGRYVIASLNGLRFAPDQLGYSGALEQTLDTRLTRVEVTYLDAAAAWASKTAVSATADGPNEPTIGRRTLSVSSWHANATDAGELASLYAQVVNAEQRLPRLGPVTYRTARTPLANVAHARKLLAGAEIGTGAGALEVFAAGTWLPRLGQRPLFGVIGGTLRYADGDWTIGLTPSRVVVDPAPFGWAPVTAAAAGLPTVRARDLDASVTFRDMGFVDVGAGLTTSTVKPYKGNPT